MSEKLTKSAIKKELTRRIDWIEHRFNFTEDTSLENASNDYAIEMICFYRCLKIIKWQVENNLFIDGFLK